MTIARFLVSATNPNVADPASQTILVAIPHPTFDNHNGGMVAFDQTGVCMRESVMEGVQVIQTTTPNTSQADWGNSSESIHLLEQPAPVGH